jgi:Flp pilus assembly protein TadD
MAKLYSAHAEQAQRSLQHGLRLNSSDPHNFAWLDFLALAHLFTGDTDQAVEAATEAVHLRPGWRVTLETMAICCAAAGSLEEARAYFETAEQGHAYPSDLLVPLKAHNPAWRSEIQRLLHSVRDGAPPSS